MYADRLDAANRLAQKLKPKPGAVVYGLARGGAVVGDCIARLIECPFHVLVVKKVSLPDQPELAIGAVAPDDVYFVDNALARRLGAKEDEVSELLMKQRQEVFIRGTRYRLVKKPLIPKGMPVILADDGAATGATMEVAVQWARHVHASHVTVAVPVAPVEVAKRLSTIADESIVLETPEDFRAVGQFYASFEQVSDDDVVSLLKNSDE